MYTGLSKITLLTQSEQCATIGCCIAYKKIFYKRNTDGRKWNFADPFSSRDFIQKDSKRGKNQLLKITSTATIGLYSVYKIDKNACQIKENSTLQDDASKLIFNIFHEEDFEGRKTLCKLLTRVKQGHFGTLQPFWIQ